MLNAGTAWAKTGRILAPDARREWMATCTGPAFAVPRRDAETVDVYVTGRDSQNRSRIGLITIDPERPVPPLAISDEPVFDIGEPGAFDENGVSYPWIVDADDVQYIYYVGWMPTVLTPFQNHVGLALRANGGEWRRLSRAPILPRTNDEYLSIGSTAVLREADRWRMWYTCFRRWGQRPGDPKHVYVIKFAESTDGVHWTRPNHVCIDNATPGEFSTGRPSVLRHDGLYHMWFSYRGAEYRIGYAWSENGIDWIRRDDLAGIDVSSSGWDSQAICYSHVFRWKDAFYMLYCGNRYGRDGLGLAVLARGL
jgi:hypothetical protein